MFIAVSRSKGGCRVTRQHFHNSAVRILGDRAARIEQQRLREGRETPLFPLSLSLSLLLLPPARLFDTSLFRISSLLLLSRTPPTRSIAGSILLVPPSSSSLPVFARQRERNKGGEKPGPVWRQCLR